MEATGIVRRVDDLGRIIIPKEIRNQLKIKEGQPFEVFVNKTENMVCFKKYSTEAVSDLKTQFMNLSNREKEEFLSEIGVDI